MRKFVAALALASLMPMTAQAACATKAEADAMNLRALKSALMVAALSCNQQSSYNAFINKNQSMFSADGAQVKGYFVRAYGGSAEYQLNRFVTKLANEASQVSMGQESDAYCKSMQEAFKNAVSLDKAGVAQLAASPRYASLHSIRTCTTGAQTAKLAMNSATGRNKQ